MEKEKLYELASQALRMPIEEVKKNNRFIESDNAEYFYNPSRAGGSVIIAQDGSYLAAGSAVGFEKHLEEFRKGRRNNPQ